jgi:hypothetical protein
MTFFRDIARRHVGWAVACLHWRMDDAWHATPADIHLAYESWLALHGLTPDSACSADVLKQMMMEFPDG